MTACSDTEARETPGEKNEWSVLQAVEYKQRSVPVTEPSVQRVGDFEVLGVRGFQGQNIWVLLKPMAPPHYKQMPAGNYDLPKDLVDRLVAGHRVSYTVEQVLSSHVGVK
jgi:hypothetical protein